MSGERGSFRSAGIAAAGAIAGTAATLLLSRVFLTDPQSSAPGPGAVQARAYEEGTRERSRAEYRPRAHRPNAASSSDEEAEGDAPPATHGDPSYVEPTEAEQVQLEWEDQRSLIDQHAAETRDVSWARGMETNLSSMLTDLTQTHGFSLSAIDCRSVTCTAGVSWPSLTAAQAHMSGVVEMMNLPCIKRITLPPECREDRACDATLVIDCTEDRTGPVTD